jgi:uncharacterized protein (UPF0335 family)
MQLEERKALIGFIVEIEASRERAKGETRHQSDIFKKAKEKNFDNKAMRKVLQRRAMSKNDREQLDDLVDQYEHALGGLALAKEAVSAGMSAREAAEKYNVPRAALGVITRGSNISFSSQPESKPKLDVITPPEVAALPAHDADGVVIESPAAKASDAESPQGPLTSTDLAGAAGGVDAPAPIPESCGGRGVQTTGDNPAPHASRSQQGQATPDNASPLPIEAGQECAAVGNVAKPETDPGRPPRPSPPQDPIEEISETHRGAMPSKDGAKVVRTEPSMSGSVAASGDVVRDASAMPLDVVAAPHSEGREHAGSAATAPPACDQPVASAPATDFTDKIKALSLSISPREALPAEAFKTAAQLWDEVGEQPLCLRRSA